MEYIQINGEEVRKYTLQEFISATRPDGKGYIHFNGEKIAEFTEVICDSCNIEIKQPEEFPGELVVFCLPGCAWCKQCFEEWASKQ